MYEYDEFKGNKLIVLKRDMKDQYPFKIQKRRAQLIIEHIEEIKKFAEE